MHELFHLNERPSEKGPATWYRKISEASLETRSRLWPNWGGFLKRFTELYGNTNAEEDAKMLIDSIKQGKDSIPEYTKDLEIVCTSFLIGPMIDLLKSMKVV